MQTKFKARDSSWTWKMQWILISYKFDDFERNRLEKEKIRKDLKGKVIYLRRKVDDITAEISTLEEIVC